MKPHAACLYTPEIHEEICRRLAEGEALDTICKKTSKRPDFPSAPSVRGWALGFVKAVPEDFATDYARARQIQAEGFFDEIIDIADDCTEDSASVNKARLRVDTRKWALSKMMPKRFGESSILNLGGQVDNPIEVRNEARDAASALSSEAKGKILALIHRDLQAPPPPVDGRAQSGTSSPKVPGPTGTPKKARKVRSKPKPESE